MFSRHKASSSGFFPPPAWVHAWAAVPFPLVVKASWTPSFLWLLTLFHAFSLINKYLFYSSFLCSHMGDGWYGSIHSKQKWRNVELYWLSSSNEQGQAREQKKGSETWEVFNETFSWTTSFLSIAHSNYGSPFIWERETVSFPLSEMGKKGFPSDLPSATFPYRREMWAEPLTSSWLPRWLSLRSITKMQKTKKQASKQTLLNNEQTPLLFYSCLQEAML